MEHLSIVIPALNAAAVLPATLNAVSASGAEIVVVDGGSTDSTVAVAEHAGARTVASERGRGLQLAAGVAAARGDWLLLLHADTVPEDGWIEETGGFMVEPANADRAAVFRFSTDLDGRIARFFERTVNWRGRVLGLPYGDQGLLIRRALLREIGGVKPLPIMEDVDLIKRLGRDRLSFLGVSATTSGERYRRHGLLPRVARNLTCLGLYHLGVSPSVIARLYG